jgi:hypothetical protein
MLKKIVQISCIIGCFFAAGWFCRKQTDGFTLLKISSSLSYHPEWETSNLTQVEKDEIRRVLEQPFTYLAKGEQCYVFASEDQKYVLKFFRQNHMRAPIWVEWLPSFLNEYKSKERAKKESKLHRDFASYKLAYEKLREETGLVFLHLNKTQDLQCNTILIDKLNIAHQVPLDGMEFLLQKRAKPLYPALEECIAEGRIEEGKLLICNLVQLLMKIRKEKGILDSDPDLNINFGCIGIMPMQIDIGRYQKAENIKTTQEYGKEIALITDNLHQFLEARSQVLDQCLKQEIAKLSQGEN